MNFSIVFLRYVYHDPMKNLFLIVLFLLGSSCNRNENIKDTSASVLWYTTPSDAKKKDNPYIWTDDDSWLKALPVGNGYMGAMIFGGVETERLQLNDKNLWSGSPQEANPEGFYNCLSEVRSLLLQGRNKEARIWQQRGWCVKAWSQPCVRGK